MDLSPADYLIGALPRSSIEFPIITFSLIGITCAVLAYATAASEDAEGAADPEKGGFDFENFEMKDLGFSDEPREGDADKGDDSYGFGLDEGRDDRSRSTGGRAGKKRVSRRARGGKRARSRRRGAA